MATKVIYTSSVGSSSLRSELHKLIVIGESKQLSSSEFLESGLNTLVSSLISGEVITEQLSCLKTSLKNVEEDSLHHMVGKGEEAIRISIASISDKRTRNNAVIRADLIPALISKLVSSEENVHVSFVVNDDQAFAAGCAVARAFPQYSRKSSFLSKKERTIEVGFVSASGQPLQVEIDEIQHTADSIRLTARLTDTPCSELHTDAYIEVIKKTIGELPNPELVATKIINGHDLDKGGFGGLWGVGKAAVHLPALVILTYTPSAPSESSKNIALVGKGICFDTGGLSLKSTTGMPTMKVDMGGSAAILGAFLASVRLNVPHTLHAVLCLAENSVDQLSMRPDDILTMYSGKTVEVNNTDAEGRLVLGDGVAYASHDLGRVSHIIDMATLTGAQLIATGPRHAGFMANHVEFESQVSKAAFSSGDLAYPLMYCPEFLMKDLDSEVADMKNSNKNGPTTAASSLAGHFIEAHLHPEYSGVWCHVDIAGPATKGARATGYGVALLIHIIKNIS